MKKIVSIFIFMIFLNVYSYTGYALNSNVDINVKGDIKKNNNIEIQVKLENIKNLYAASIDFEYDKSLLKVSSIEPSKFIKNDKNNIMEFGKETDKNGNIATYYFTFLGDEKGLNGSGGFVNIKAKVLKNGKLNINNKNMKIKLVEKTTKNEIVAMKFDFKGYSSENGTIIKPEIPNEGSNVDQGNTNSGTTNEGSNVDQGNTNSGTTNEGSNVDQGNTNSGITNEGSNVDQGNTNSGTTNEGSNKDQGNTNSGTASEGSNKDQGNTNSSTASEGTNIQEDNNIINENNKLDQDSNDKSNSKDNIDTSTQETVIKSSKTNNMYIVVIIGAIVLCVISYITYKKYKNN